MDDDTAWRLVSGILSTLDAVPDLDDPAAVVRCVDSLCDGRLHDQTPADTLQAIDIVTSHDELSRRCSESSRRFDGDQIMAFVRAVGAELLSRKLRIPANRARGLTNQILYGISYPPELGTAEPARRCADAMFEGVEFSPTPSEFLEAIDAVVVSGRLPTPIEVLTRRRGYTEAEILGFLRALGAELRRRLDVV